MSKKRKQLTINDLWNVESYYKDTAAWQKNFDEVSDDHISSLWQQIEKRRGQLKDKQQIKAVLDGFFTLQQRIVKLLTYAHLKRDEDTSNETSQSRFAKANDLHHRFQLATTWIEPELISWKDQLNHLLDSESLQEHRFYLLKLKRFRPHALPPDQEALLALSQKALQTPHLAFSSLNDTDLRFDAAVDANGKKHQLTQGTHALHLKSSDRSLRQSSFENLHKSYADHQFLMTQLLEGICQTHIFEARARKFPSALNAALFGNDVAISIYENLISTVKSRVKTLQRYLLLRKKALGVDELNPWDLHVPLVVEKEKTYSFDEAVELVLAASTPLGEDYIAALKQGLKVDRWIDRFETEHKRSGAYSSGCWGQLPLILLNYQGTLQDVFTLAHEAGHSMHSFFSWRHQPYQNADYTIFAAEVASTLSEDLLFAHLLKKAETKSAKARLIYQKLEEIRATLFRQTLFAEFEWCIHEICEKGEGLTAQLLNRLYRSLNQEYCGSSCQFPDIWDTEWARIPHFYYNFYVFQYATGISAAEQLSQHLLSRDKERAQKRYLDFLRSGGSDFPIDQLKKAGVDMSKPEPIIALLDRFEDLVKELEELI